MGQWVMGHRQWPIASSATKYAQSRIMTLAFWGFQFFDHQLAIGGGTTEPSDFGPLKITLWITMIISGMYILHWVYYTLAAG